MYLGIGVTCAGRKEVLGLWIEQTEGARFWFAVMNELKARGLRDVLIAVVDGLKGFPEAIESVYPQATVQKSIVHMIRHSLAPALAGRVVEGAQVAGGGGCAGRVRGGSLGAEVSGDRSQLAFVVGPGGAVLRLFRADPAGDRHDERDREVRTARCGVRSARGATSRTTGRRRS